MLLLGFVLNLIKTLAINTNHGTLTDKGMWINPPEPGFPVFGENLTD